MIMVISDGKTIVCRFKTFWEKQTRIMRNWHFQMKDREWRVVLGNILTI